MRDGETARTLGMLISPRDDPEGFASYPLSSAPIPRPPNHRLEQQPVLHDRVASYDEAVVHVELHNERGRLALQQVQPTAQHLDLDARLVGARELEADDRLTTDHGVRVIVERHARLRRIDDQ